MVQGAHRSIAGFIAAAMLIAACSGDVQDSAQSTTENPQQGTTEDSPQGTAGYPPQSTTEESPDGPAGNPRHGDAGSLPLPEVIESRSFTPELEHAGRWDIFRVPDGGSVIGIVDAGTAPVAVIAAAKWDRPNRNRLRLYEPVGDGWEPITDWVGPDTDTMVSWKSASVLDGSIVVTARKNGPDGLPMSIVFDPASDPQMTAPSRTAGAERRLRLGYITSGASSLRAIQLGAGRKAIWQSPDGLQWGELGPPEGWPGDTVALLEFVHWDGIWAIRARRGEGRNKTDFVMTSRDGIEWQTADFRGSGYDGITQVDAVGSDRSGLVALGYQAAGVVTQASTDGVTWSAPRPMEPGIFGDFPPRFGKIVSYPDGAFLAGVTHHNTDYRHCYVPGRACQVRLNTVWMAHDGTWQPIVAPSGSETKAVALIDDTLYVGGDRRIATWIPDEPGTIPVASFPVEEPPRFGARPHGGCSPLQPGVTYAWIGHEDSAHFNEIYWEIDTVTDDAAEILAESGAVEVRYPDDEPTIYGTVELISPDRIEWSIPGYGPIAYLRAGDPLPGNIGCSL